MMMDPSYNVKSAPPHAGLAAAPNRWSCAPSYVRRAGVCTYPDGSRYEGDFEADARSGWGRLDAAGGDSYEGEWRADKMHGGGENRGGSVAGLLRVRV